MLAAGPEYDEDLSLVVLKAGMQEHTTLPINQVMAHPDPNPNNITLRLTLCRPWRNRGTFDHNCL